MQPPQKFIARFEELELYNSRFAEFSFELIEPNELIFEAGQYVSLKVSPLGERRSYSMCSTPDVSNGFQTLIDLQPMGVGGHYLKNLTFGDTVELLAPMGQFVVPADITQEHLVFVATGSGVSPFRSMIEDQLRLKQTTKKITLHWGMRHADELFWLDIWQDLVDAFPNFQFHPVLSDAPDEWTLCRGRVTDCLKVHQLPANAAYFLCGNQRMITEVTEFLTQEMQIPATDVHTEKFY